MPTLAKFAALALFASLGVPAHAAGVDCDNETSSACHSEPLPPHKPDPAIKEAPSAPPQDRFAAEKGVRIDLSSPTCLMKASLCHCTNKMIAERAARLGAKISAAYAFPGAALVRGELGGKPFEIVISREGGCPVIRQR